MIKGGEPTFKKNGATKPAIVAKSLIFSVIHVTVSSRQKNWQYNGTPGGKLVILLGIMFAFPFVSTCTGHPIINKDADIGSLFSNKVNGYL